MKQYSRVFLILLIGVSCAWAHLSDSYDKVDDSYGNLVERHLLDDGTVSDLCEKEIARFLKANAAGATWVPDKASKERRFKRSDGKAEAIYANVNGRPGADDAGTWPAR